MKRRDEHHCEWRDKAEALEDRVATLEALVGKLQRHTFGQRSEKMPPIEDELRRASPPRDPEAALERRRDNASTKQALPAREIVHKVAEGKKVCPKCGGHDFAPLGRGKVTTVYEYVPARFE